MQKDTPVAPPDRRAFTEGEVRIRHRRMTPCAIESSQARPVQ